MLTKIACVTVALTVASMAPAHAGGLLGGNGNRGGLINVSPNLNLGLGNVLSNNSLLNGNKTGLLSGILNGNKTSVDALNNDNDRGGYNKKKRRH